jgi:membrane glycosyltransferase
MSPEERRTWIFAITAPVAYIVYLVIILSAGATRPLTEVAYQPVLIATVCAVILTNIVLTIFAGGRTKGAPAKDQRDREIYAFGEYTGRAFLVIGGVAALILAMLRINWFWIANAVYLCFVLNAILSSIARLVAYRGGLPPVTR